MGHELIKRNPKHPGRLRTNQEVSGLLKTSVFLSDFSKVNILNSFHYSSVTWILPLLCYRWLTSLVDILQGVAKLNY